MHHAELSYVYWFDWFIQPCYAVHLGRHFICDWVNIYITMQTWNYYHFVSGDICISEICYSFWFLISRLKVISGSNLYLIGYVLKSPNSYLFTAFLIRECRKSWSSFNWVIVSSYSAIELSLSFNLSLFLRALSWFIFLSSFGWSWTLDLNELIFKISICVSKQAVM